MTVYEYLKSKGVSRWSEASKLMKGKTVKIINKTTYNDYGEIGDKFVINAWSSPSSTVLTQSTNGCLRTGHSGYFIYLKDLEICEDTLDGLTEEIQAKQKQIEQLTKEIQDTESKIAFMKANKLTEFSEEEFKIYEILKTLDSKTSNLKKAQAISKLIKK